MVFITIMSSINVVKLHCYRFETFRRFVTRRTEISLRVIIVECIIYTAVNRAVRCVW